MKNSRRVLVLQAGSGPGNTLIRALKAGDPSLFVAGCNDDRFALKRSLADCNYLVPFPEQSEFGNALARVVGAERIQLVVPTSDANVKLLSDLRDHIPCRVFLAPRAVIDRCQDKYELTKFLGRRGLPVPRTHAVNGLKDIAGLFGRLAPRSRRLWCRIRRGTGSFGALLVESPAQTRNWIKCWQDMNGVPAASFTLSEYLPGRDFSVQSLWKDGKLVMAKSHERLSYFVTGGGPSNVSSMAALAKVIHEPRVLEVGTKAVRALDPKASGPFFVDIKENARGQPCITEINTGRFSSVSLTHDLVGPDNMALAYVKSALGTPPAARKGHVRRVVDECYVMRDLDALPAIVRSSELFEGIRDARG